MKPSHPIDFTFRPRFELLEDRSVPSAGDFDPSFGSIPGAPGREIADFDGYDAGRAVAVDPAGRIVVAGTTSPEGGQSDFAIVRYLPNGDFDRTFSEDGRLTTDFAGGFDSLHDMALQADGKIVVVGETTTTAGARQFAIARYTVDGKLDLTFNGSGKLTGSAFAQPTTLNSVIVLDDNRILAGGSISSGSGGMDVVDDFMLVRLNADGSFDGSFAGGGVVVTDLPGPSGSVLALDLQADGGIVAAGTIGFSHVGLARYDLNGNLDGSFGTGGFVDAGNGIANSVTVQSDNKIVIGGDFFGHAEGTFGVARFAANGAADSDFSGDGFAFAGAGGANGVAVQADGKILAVGSMFDQSLGRSFAKIARFRDDGEPDTFYSDDGVDTFHFGFDFDNNLQSFASDIALQGDGKILVAGTVLRGEAPTSFGVARLFSGQEPFVQVFLRTTAEIADLFGPGGALSPFSPLVGDNLLGLFQPNPSPFQLRIPGLLTPMESGDDAPPQFDSSPSDTAADTPADDGDIFAHDNLFADNFDAPRFTV